MNVTLKWSETVNYSTELTIDDEELGDVAEWAEKDRTEVTALDVRRYFLAGDEEWFERCDTNDDFVGVEDRVLYDVQVRA